MRLNIVYIAAILPKAFHFQWMVESLDKKKFDLKFILLNLDDSEMERYLTSQNIPVERVIFRGKRDLIPVTFRSYRILKKWKPDVVHTHLLEANIVGLIAAWLAGVPKRIYTRHHSDLHHAYFPKGVKYDRVCNWLATDIISPSQITKKILEELEKVPPRKIHLIHHFFKLNAFESVPKERIDVLRQKYGLENFHPVIGVISRYAHWKGVQFIIPAFKELLKYYPNAHLILANASLGDNQKEIKDLLGALPKGSYNEIVFEEDSPALYKLFDVFVHVPITKKCESFGQIYIEALASGVPAVFTLSGIANEFIRDKENALLVDPGNPNQIFEALLQLLADKKIADRLIINGKESVKQFSIESIIPLLEELYVQ